MPRARVEEFEGKDTESLVRAWFHTCYKLLLAIHNGSRKEVEELHEQGAEESRALLMAVLAGWRPRRKKGLAEVDRCFKVCSVAFRDLLLAIHAFLGR